MSGNLIKHDTKFGTLMTDESRGFADIICDGMATAVIQVDGTDTISILVQGTTNGHDWDDLEVISLAGYTHAWATINYPGLWATGCAGLERIRVTIELIVGTVMIRYGLSTAAFSWPYCCASEPQ